ncbi:MAG: DUF6166 domain-containing protein [Gemmataceae bacterium]
MKTYSGVRTAAGCAVTVTDADGCRALDPRFDLRTHSPEGFEWGYGGSGPAQLALALAADALGDDDAALGVYQRLKFRLVGRLPAAGWTLTTDELAETLAALGESDAE